MAEQRSDGSLDAVLRDVARERARQDEKWGQQDHDPMTWLPVLMEEVGEAAQEALRLRFNAPNRKYLVAYREEMVQVAAVAVAAIEALDRGVGGSRESE